MTKDLSDIYPELVAATLPSRVPIFFYEGDYYGWTGATFITGATSIDDMAYRLEALASVGLIPTFDKEFWRTSYDRLVFKYEYQVKGAK